VKSNKTSDK